MRYRFVLGTAALVAALGLGLQRPASAATTGPLSALRTVVNNLSMDDSTSTGNSSVDLSGVSNESFAQFWQNLFDSLGAGGGSDSTGTPATFDANLDLPGNSFTANLDNLKVSPSDLSFLDSLPFGTLLNFNANLNVPGSQFTAHLEITKTPTEPPVIPEPSSLALTGVAGMIGAAVFWFRRRRG